MGIRLADFVVRGLRERGCDVELIDAKAVGLPMLDRMYKEYAKGEAPAAMEALARQDPRADGFVFVTGEYNWGVQPGPEEPHRSFPRGMVLAAGRDRQLFGRAFRRCAGRIGLADTLSEMGMVVISSSLAVGPIAQTLSAEGEPTGDGGKALTHAFPRFADDLLWWVEAAKTQRAKGKVPY